ncbi:MAG: hypothetical protein KAX09_06840 [Candidatus Heimdallarchaeota archaeon]|nr:hypothetical protein [Candidatus Heimdallarchaeota archaeon]MCK4290684.1 hypothetical protein [Candidatus Heimdallarchaeota archaeon]
MTTKKITTKLLVIILLITSFTPLISSAEKPDILYERNIKPETTKNWTFMLYFGADTRDDYVTSSLDNSGNWLAAAMLTTMTYLEWYDILASSTSNLNIIAMFDHPYTPGDPNGRAKIYDIRTTGRIELVDYGPKNMGHPSTLSDFIDYCKTNFPADNYALTLSDHGRGYAGLIYDYHAPHESWDYALGDCLSVPEVELALSSAGGVDVLMLDICQGGSYELMWQLRGEARYVVAGETLQTHKALYHPRDILYTLSRDTTMTALELAQVAYDFAVAPDRVPSDPYYSAQWPTATLYELNRFDAIPITGGYSLFYAFTKLTEYLYNEVLNNLTYAREVFIPLRNQLSYPTSAFKSKAMLVDLGDFVTTLLEHSDEFHYQTEIENYGGEVLARLVPGSIGPIRSHAYKPAYVGKNLTGFSICFPDTSDMYQEYLYANLYDEFVISDATFWDEFIFSIYPPGYNFLDIPIPEFFEEIQFFMGPIDPTIHLDIYIDAAQYEQPMHIGYAGPITSTGIGMGLEVDIEGASFEDTLVQGSTMVRIPVSSIPSFSKSSPQDIQVVVNASTAASATQDVNLTVRHVDSTGILWEDSMTSEIQVGQVISTNVSSNDEWTEWEELAPPLPTKRFSGIDTTTASVSIIFITVVTILIFRRKKKL